MGATDKGAWEKKAKKRGKDGGFNDLEVISPERGN